MRVHPNRRRGEIDADFDGEPRLLCLTLGALAELESVFGVANLSDLAARFEAGLSADDIIRILGAGLRGAGNRVSDEDVAQMSAEGGAAGFARIATELLWVSFGGGETGRALEPARDREGASPLRTENPPRAAGGAGVTERDRTFFPWASVIRFGLGHLRLTPDAFWRLSLIELTALIGADEPSMPATRQRLEALMAQFPDMTPNKEPADGR